MSTSQLAARRFILAAPVAALLLLLSACNGSTGAGLLPDPIYHPDNYKALALEKLPPQFDGCSPFSAPSGYLRQTSTGPSDEQRVILGSDIQAGLPNQNMDDALPGPPDPSLIGRFYPQPPQDGNRIAAAAYCMYQFSNMGSYNGPARLELQWEQAPATGNLFVALGNLQNDRWDWYVPDAAGGIELSSFEPYTEQFGDILVAVLVLGEEERHLEWLLAGDQAIVEVAIEHDLKVNLSQNLAPLTVNFNALVDFYGGAAAGYAWDFESDGSIDFSGAEADTAQHTFSEPGTYEVTLTFSGSAGAELDATLLLTAVDPANQPPVASLVVDDPSGEAPHFTYLYASGSHDDGSIVSYQWDINSDGFNDFDTGAQPWLDHVFMRAGFNPVTLTVTDNDFASDTASALVSLSGGWKDSVIDSGIYMPEAPALTVLGAGNSARPCIAYQDLTGKDLYFAHASAVDGSNWDPPVAPVDNAGKVGFSPVMLPSSLTGFPMLAFGNQDAVSGDYSLWMAKAGNIEGSTWGQYFSIETQRNVGSRNAMVMVDGDPAIWTVENAGQQGMNTLLLYRALDGTAIGWDEEVQFNLGIPFDFYIGLDAGLALGQPICSLCLTGDNNALGHFLLNDNDSTFSSLRFTETLQGTSLIDALGLPAVAAGSNTISGRLLYSRAQNPSGTAWEEAQVLAPAGQGGKPAMALIDNVPTIAWTSGNSLYYLQAEDAAGSAWAETRLIQCGGNLGPECQLANSFGHPVIVYTEILSGEVRAAWFQPAP
jgi:hypothetical protein